MRDNIIDVITTAANSIGIQDVLENPNDPESMLLPRPRVDFKLGDEKWIKDTRKIAAFATPENEENTRTTRTRLYTVSLPVVVTIHSEDDGAIDGLATNFVLAMPRKFADAAGNLVKCKAEAAKWGGFSRDMVEVMKLFSKAIHITITWQACSDSTTPWIQDVDINANYETGGRENGQEG